MTKGMVKIDVSPLHPYLDAKRAADITARGANCPLAGDVSCPDTGRIVRFSFDMGNARENHPPCIHLSVVSELRPTDDEVRWFFRFSNVLRGVEFRPHHHGFVRNFTIGNNGDYVTLLPGGSA